jgi:hypothetical protein
MVDVANTNRPSAQNVAQHLARVALDEPVVAASRPWVVTREDARCECGHSRGQHDDPASGDTRCLVVDERSSLGQVFDDGREGHLAYCGCLRFVEARQLTLEDAFREMDELPPLSMSEREMLRRGISAGLQFTDEAEREGVDRDWGLDR